MNDNQIKYLTKMAYRYPTHDWLTAGIRYDMDDIAEVTIHFDEPQIDTHGGYIYWSSFGDNRKIELSEDDSREFSVLFPSHMIYNCKFDLRPYREVEANE